MPFNIEILFELKWVNTYSLILREKMSKHSQLRYFSQIEDLNLGQADLDFKYVTVKSMQEMLLRCMSRNFDQVQLFQLMKFSRLKIFQQK